MERYQQLFTRLESSKEGAFVPFVTLGDPNPALSLQIIDTLIEAGADALELGIPFSDPLADGPTIKARRCAPSPPASRRPSASRCWRPSARSTRPFPSAC